jgi:hypothetical protein
LGSREQPVHDTINRLQSSIDPRAGKRRMMYLSK